MESANILLQAVSQVGFPIVAFGLIFFYMNKTQKENTQAINNNTLAITKLAEKLGEDI